MAIVALTITINLALFFIGGGVLHWWFHGRLRERHEEWKHQPGRFQSRRDMVRKLPLVVFNGLILQSAVGLGVWAMFEGRTQAFWEVGAASWPYLLASSAAMFLWYHVALYYVHRLMHRPRMFRWFHRIHHEQKSPIFLDALYEHPVEAAWGALEGIPITLAEFEVSAEGLETALVVPGLDELTRLAAEQAGD